MHTNKSTNSELISEGTFADLYSLCNHNRIPTKLELDRFIRGYGYVKLADDQTLPTIPFKVSHEYIVAAGTQLAMQGEGWKKVT